MAKKRGPIKSRIFNLCQYERNPKTGEDLHFSELNIKAGLQKKSIKKWAYILHDDDKYTEEDCPAWAKPGDPKPRHWHLVAWCERAVELSAFASWFGVPENQVDLPKGAGAFLDCVEYLTHENPVQQEKGKTLYPDDRVTSNFGWRADLEKRAERKVRTGRPLNLGEEMVSDVYEGLKTIKQCWEQDPVTASAFNARLERARERYLSMAPPPPARINYYITGSSGQGKSYLANALARALFPGLPDDEVFFEVGEGAAAFSGYDGQPVVIWHDKRAIDLLQLLGGRGNVFDVFNNQPTRRRQNRKFGSVSLINSVNIVESIQPWQEFLDGLAGEYKDKQGNLHETEDKEKAQSYRRFPVIIPLHAGDFDVLLNRGYLEDNDSFLGYVQYHNVRANLQRIARTLGTGEAARQITGAAVAPVVELHAGLLGKMGAVAEQVDPGVMDSLRPEVSHTYENNQRALAELAKELEAISAPRVHEADEDTDGDIDNYPEVPEEIQTVLEEVAKAAPHTPEGRVKAALEAFFRDGGSVDEAIAILNNTARRTTT